MRVLVFGTFDHLHPGHEFLLHEGLKRGELSVVVARDSTTERIKGRKPEQPASVRINVIRQAFPAATVILGDPEKYLAPVEAAQPDLILLGYDQKLPPGVSMDDFPCPVERLPAFAPEQYKSSLRRGRERE